MKLDLKRQMLYVRSMGKLLQVTALFITEDSCNTWLAANRDHGVVAVFGPFILVAGLYDKGVPGGPL